MRPPTVQLADRAEPRLGAQRAAQDVQSFDEPASPKSFRPVWSFAICIKGSGSNAICSAIAVMPSSIGAIASRETRRGEVVDADGGRAAHRGTPSIFTTRVTGCSGVASG